MILTKERFIQLTGVVIDNFESGYYHPDMAKHFKPSDQALLAASGETMFGLDRKAGAGELAKYDGWNEFWAVIDAADAKHKWKHYYLGGSLAPRLKELAGNIMYTWFSKLTAKYLSPADIEKIAADDRLVIHFAYACWNGAFWFNKFAAALKAATGTKDEILDKAMKARTMANSKAIRNGGIKMYKLFNNMG